MTAAHATETIAGTGPGIASLLPYLLEAASGIEAVFTMSAALRQNACEKHGTYWRKHGVTLAAEHGGERAKQVRRRWPITLVMAATLQQVSPGNLVRPGFGHPLTRCHDESGDEDKSLHLR